MKEKMNEKILLAGSGGQGVMFLGKTIARAAARENKQTTWIPSYGAEMRGGTAHCFVRISSLPIAAPVFENPTIAVVLNQPSFDKFAAHVVPGGTIIMNSSLASGTAARKITVFRAPLNEWALALGAQQAVNILALGVLARHTAVVKEKTLEQVIKESFIHKKELVQLNLKALHWGYTHG